MGGWPFRRAQGPEGRAGDPFTPPALRAWVGELEGKAVTVYTMPSAGFAPGVKVHVINDPTGELTKKVELLVEKARR